MNEVQEFNKNLAECIKLRSKMLASRGLKNREEMWQGISDELKVPVIECKKRWKLLRDTYRRFQNKKLKGKATLPDSFLGVDLSFIEDDEDDNDAVIENNEIKLTVTDVEKYLQYRNVKTYLKPNILRKLPSPTLDSKNTLPKDNIESNNEESFNVHLIENIKTEEMDIGETEIMVTQDKPNNIRVVAPEHISPFPLRHDIPSEDIVSRNNDNNKSEMITERDKNITITHKMNNIIRQNNLLRKRLAIIKKKRTPTHSFFSAMADVVCHLSPEVVADVRMKVCTIVTNAEMNCLYRQT